ncbi:MAG: TolC family protein [Chitinophagia bacterium]|nr:TolC family protein [Chitinophagia bacterium]
MRTKSCPQAILLAILLTTSVATKSQTDPGLWDLRRCVEYAVRNSISVRQTELDARTVEVTLWQSEQQRIPTLAGNLNHGLSFGRTLDRTTNIFVSRSAMFEQVSLQSNALLYNFRSLRYQIDANRLNAEAAQATVERARNDIALNVANQYLRALLSHEQVELSRIVLRQTRSQLANTRKLVEAGTLPELNAAELEATEARDSATLVQTRAQLQLDILGLKNLLTLPADAPFEIAIPAVADIPVENILEQDPQAIYLLALSNQPQIKGNALRAGAAERQLQATLSRRLPSISAFAQLNSNFNQFLQKTTGYTLAGEAQTGAYVKSGTTVLPVYSPQFSMQTSRKSFGELWNGWGKQLSDQFGQGIGFNISVPILNGGQNKANIERARIDVRRQALVMEQDSLRLKQDIYTAHQSALGAFQTLQARAKAVQTAERSFELATRRFELGVMQTIEWLTIQNNLTRARIDRLVAQYDFVFRMKVLEFYKGRGIRL